MGIYIVLLSIALCLKIHGLDNMILIIYIIASNALFISNLSWFKFINFICKKILYDFVTKMMKISITREEHTNNHEKSNWLSELKSRCSVIIKKTGKKDMKPLYVYMYCILYHHKTIKLHFKVHWYRGSFKKIFSNLS